jgi:hypothetical protein
MASYEHGNEVSGSMKGEERLEGLEQATDLISEIKTLERN